MGSPSRFAADQRHWFLRRSRLHVFYQVHGDSSVIVIASLRHERQRPPK